MKSVLASLGNELSQLRADLLAESDANPFGFSSISKSKGIVANAVSKITPKAAYTPGPQSVSLTSAKPATAEEWLQFIDAVPPTVESSKDEKGNLIFRFPDGEYRVIRPSDIATWKKEKQAAETELAQNLAPATTASSAAPAPVVPQVNQPMAEASIDDAFDIFEEEVKEAAKKEEKIDEVEEQAHDDGLIEVETEETCTESDEDRPSSEEITLNPALAAFWIPEDDMDALVAAVQNTETAIGKPSSKVTVDAKSSGMVVPDFKKYIKSRTPITSPAIRASAETQAIVDDLDDVIGMDSDDKLLKLSISIPLK